jgi:ATP-dependent DNA helicase RecQ
MPTVLNSNTTPLQTLKSIFGYAAFRGHQAQIVDHVVAGGDALVLMPTGGGKSLCYQIPAIVRQARGQGITVVVSPLIALMHDQVSALHESGISAAYLNSSLSMAEASKVEQQLLRGEITLLYAAPERISQPRFLGLLHSLYEREQLALFAIDEAHCVSQWGHDFRPEYRALTVLHEQFPNTPRIALTATADTLTRSDIVERLQLEGAAQFVSSFDRPNIEYHIVEKVNARKQLLTFIQNDHQDEAGIVYCLSRKKVEEVATYLNEEGIAALPYHAGLDRALRQRNQDIFLKGEHPIVMVATIAFGMGIDKPDVRFVAHIDMPKNIEGYYQETGRAGRDGAPAMAWLCYGLGDVVSQNRMIDESLATDAYKTIMRNKLDALVGLAETIGCRREHLLRYFDDCTLSADVQSQATVKTGTDTPSRAYCCQSCDNCIKPPTAWDASTPAKMLLSCVYRMQQASPNAGFAAGHTIDVLRGHLSVSVERFRHNAISTFGIGKGLSEAQWRTVLRRLVGLGWVAVDAQHHNALSVLAAGSDFLRNPNPVPLNLRKMADRTERAREKSSKSSQKITRTSQVSSGLGKAYGELKTQSERIFQNLRVWRLSVAKENSMPAYAIFQDATLQAIAELAPKSTEQLGGVTGVGARKLASYGSAILGVVASQLE